MNKNYLILLLVIVLVAGSFLAGQFMVGPSISGTGNIAGVIHGGISCAQIKRADGKVEDLGCLHNQFMNEGSEYIADEVATSGSGDAVNQILLGNTSDTTDGTLTDHPGTIKDCNLEAATVTWADVTGTGNISVTHTWTVNCSSVVVNTTGLNCSTCAAATNYFAGNNFTSTATLSSGDQLNVTWFVWAA